MSGTLGAQACPVGHQVVEAQVLVSLQLRFVLPSGTGRAGLQCPECSFSP